MEQKRNHQRTAKRRRRQQIRRRFLLMFIISLFMAFLILFVGDALGSLTKENNADSIYAFSAEESQDMEIGNEDDVPDIALADNNEERSLQDTVKNLNLSVEELKEKAQEIYQNNKELLLLVNKDHEFDLSAQPKLRNICYGRLEAADICYKDLSTMLSDASDEGYTYWIASAYRSRERQQELIEEDVKENRNKGMSKDQALEEVFKESMPAGYSEHETGLAFDILASSNMNMDATQETTEENKWMQENCSNYGFVLRYPKEKEDLTKISYEPWHFRYVGIEAAQFLTEYDLTLEEFYELLDLE